jgi:hypothetical protein
VVISQQKVTSVAAPAKDLSCLEEVTLTFFEFVFFETADCFLLSLAID